MTKLIIHGCISGMLLSLVAILPNPPERFIVVFILNIWIGLTLFGADYWRADD